MCLYAPLDYERVTAYYLMVGARNRGVPQRAVRALVTVEVIDIDQN